MISANFLSEQRQGRFCQLVRWQQEQKNHSSAEEPTNGSEVSTIETKDCIGCACTIHFNATSDKKNNRSACISYQQVVLFRVSLSASPWRVQHSRDDLLPQQLLHLLLLDKDVLLRRRVEEDLLLLLLLRLGTGLLDHQLLLRLLQHNLLLLFHGCQERLAKRIKL